jgi:hypothetical protein
MTFKVLFLLLTSVTLLSGCKPAYPPIPKPQPLNAPVDTQAAIDAVIAQPKPIPNPSPRLTGPVTRRTLANWLITRQGGIKKLARPARLLVDVSDPDLSAALSMSPWSVVFFPNGVDGRSRFNGQAPVTRAEFCLLACLLAGQYPTWASKSNTEVNAAAPPGGEPFEALMDSQTVPKLFRPAVAWAYQAGVMQQAFDLSPQQAAEVGLHPGQAVQWEDIMPTLIRWQPTKSTKTPVKKLHR